MSLNNFHERHLTSNNDLLRDLSELPEATIH